MKGWSRQGAVSFQALGSRLHKLPAQILPVKILVIRSCQSLVGTLQIMLFMFLAFPHTMLHCYCTALALAVQIKFALLWWECVVCSHVQIFIPCLSPSAFLTLWRLCFCFLLVCSYTLLFSTFFHSRNLSNFGHSCLNKITNS